MQRRIENYDQELIAKDNIIRAMTSDNVMLAKKMIDYG